MTEQIRGLTGEQIRALEMLAGCPDGCTQAVFEGQWLHDRVARQSDPRRTRYGDAEDRGGRGRTPGVVRLAITGKGRTMIVR
jgi:hypothetical protein